MEQSRDEAKGATAVRVDQRRRRWTTRETNGQLFAAEGSVSSQPSATFTGVNGEVGVLFREQGLDKGLVYAASACGFIHMVSVGPDAASWWPWDCGRKLEVSGRYGSRSE